MDRFVRKKSAKCKYPGFSFQLSSLSLFSKTIFIGLIQLDPAYLTLVQLDFDLPQSAANWGFRSTVLRRPLNFCITFTLSFRPLPCGDFRIHFRQD